jgi:hypothetical protein
MQTEFDLGRKITHHPGQMSFYEQTGDDSRVEEESSEGEGGTDQTKEGGEPGFKVKDGLNPGVGGKDLGHPPYLKEKIW